MFKKINREYLCSFILAVALFFMLCLYEPLNIFFSNQRDYPCDFYVIFPECLGMFLILTAVAAAVLLALYFLLKKVYHYVVGVLLWGYLCLYIQGNYMISKLPLLDGQYIRWERYSDQTIISSCFWIAMLALCLVAVKKIKREKFVALAQYVGIFISLVLLVTGITVGISNGGFEKRLELASTSKNMLDYSSDTNFIILVMDSMETGVENQVLEKYPEYREALADFTYYDNVTPGYLFTVFELPYLYGGEMYKGETTFDDYLDKVYMESDFVRELDKRNYRFQAYTADVPLNTGVIKEYENVIDYKFTVVDHVAFCKVLLRMTGYKYAPFVLKKYTQVLPGELNRHLQKPEGVRVWNFDDTNIPFYRSLEDDFVVSRKKCFKLLHLSAAHYPFEFTKDVELVQYSSYEDNMACSNTIIKAYLEKLKAEGLYDNSVIFITADHSIGEDNDNYKRMRPVLFVKGIGERHDEMWVNSAPIAHADYKEAYFRLLDGARSDEIFDWNEGDKRDRVIMLYGTQPGDDLVEYIQTGYSYEVDTLYESGNVYHTK